MIPTTPRSGFHFVVETQIQLHDQKLFQSRLAKPDTQPPHDRLEYGGTGGRHDRRRIDIFMGAERVEL
jgi:hypothetical protein